MFNSCGERTFMKMEIGRLKNEFHEVALKTHEVSFPVSP